LLRTYGICLWSDCLQQERITSLADQFVFFHIVEKKEEDKYWLYKQIGLLTAIPFILAIGPILGYFIGSWLDKKLGTEPYLMILFIVFGFVASAKQVYNFIVRSTKEEQKK